MNNYSETEKLFYQDPYCRCFEAVVTDSRQKDDSTWVLLDRTAFYPEGGGQNPDHGILVCADGKKLHVSDVQIEEELIWHKTDGEIAKGTGVRGEIDWERRFDLMQNHTGEHIVSGLIHEKWQYNNVGFHMGSDFITIDLDGILTMDQLREIEEKANQVIWQDLPVGIDSYDEESAADMTYRSKKELHGLVRLVTVPDADVCACCGLHVSRTGQIGLIRIVSVEKFHSGVRIEMLSGARAFRYDTRMLKQNQMISVALSAKPAETAAAVEKQQNNASLQKQKNVEMRREIASLKARLLTGAGNTALFCTGYLPDEIRVLGDAVKDTCGGVCAVFSPGETDVKYVIASLETDVRPLCKQMNEALDGRGGGKPSFVQGSCKADRERVMEWLKTESGLDWIFD